MLLREFDKLEYFDSKSVILKLSTVNQLVVKSNLQPEIKTLRTNKLKKYREGRECAIFCYGIGEVVINTTVYHCVYEKYDFDCIACWVKDDEVNYNPIQIKELVPDKINNKISINDELNKLKKYSSNNLTIAYHLNKRIKLNFSDIEVPDLKIAELWFFGSCSPDGSKWFLYGNVLNNPNYYEFTYPTT